MDIRTTAKITTVGAGNKRTGIIILMSTTEKLIKTHCNTCGGTKNHKILHEEVRDFRDPLTGDFYVEWQYTYRMVECGGCGEVAYHTTEFFSEGFGGDDDDYFQHYRFPQAQLRAQPDWGSALPFEIIFVVDELYTALNNRSRYLASSGIRTVLDMIIVDKIGDVGTFKDKVKKLIADGHLTAAEGDIVSIVIDAGSASAHRGFMPDDKTLSSMMDILERLIDKLYLEEVRHQELLRKAKEIKKKVPPRHP